MENSSSEVQAKRNRQIESNKLINLAFQHVCVLFFFASSLQNVEHVVMTQFLNICQCARCETAHKSNETT